MSDSTLLAFMDAAWENKKNADAAGIGAFIIDKQFLGFGLSFQFTSSGT